jgi:HNH/ENDO VII superfamily nuclease
MSAARNAAPSSPSPIEEQLALEKKCGIQVDTVLAISSVLQALPTCLARASIRKRVSATSSELTGKYAVHHLIPIIFATHDVVWRVRGLWDQNDPVANGIALPISRAQSLVSKLPYHSGPHPQYSRRIEICLNQMAEFRDRVGWSSEKLLPVFDEFVALVRKAVLSLAPGMSVNDCSIAMLSFG